MSIIFQHQHTAHCESGVMSSMLKHEGLDISEPMVFGLASALTFADIPLIKLNSMPLVSFRMPPRSIIKGVQKRLGLDIHFQKFGSPKEGMRALDHMLESEQPVGLQTSVYWLPYFPEDMRFHFNAHNLIVYGKQGDNYQISDPIFESPVECNAQSLEKSRFAKGALAAKGAMYYIKKVPSEIDFETAIKQAIKKNVRIMHAPIPIIGLKGIRRLARKIELLPKKQSDKYIRLYLGHLVRMQEEIGTGGAGFRFIYASFLQEAGELLSNEQLKEASELMTNAGDRWREFALHCVKICKQRGKDSSDLRSLSQSLLQCADEEAKVWQALKSL